jgi:hypothetical protein
VSLAALALAAVLVSSAQDGHWKGRLDGGEKAAKVSFDVSRDGSRLKDFRTTVSAFCVGPTIETNHLAILIVSIPRTKVHRGGQFAKTSKTDGGGTYKISGTLRGRHVRDGAVDVNVSTCGGHDTWTARRTAR